MGSIPTASIFFFAVVRLCCCCCCERWASRIFAGLTKGHVLQAHVASQSPPKFALIQQTGEVMSSTPTTFIILLAILHAGVDGAVDLIQGMSAPFCVF